MLTAWLPGAGHGAHAMTGTSEGLSRVSMAGFQQGPGRTEVSGETVKMWKSRESHWWSRVGGGYRNKEVDKSQNLSQ